jgi:signal transduction histidine kinase
LLFIIEMYGGKIWVESQPGERLDALFIGGDSFFSGRGVQLATLAVRERLPASANARELAAAGVLSA